MPISVPPSPPAPPSAPAPPSPPTPPSPNRPAAPPSPPATPAIIGRVEAGPAVAEPQPAGTASAAVDTGYAGGAIADQELARRRIDRIVKQFTDRVGNPGLLDVVKQPSRCCGRTQRRQRIERTQRRQRIEPNADADGSADEPRAASGSVGNTNAESTEPTRPLVPARSAAGELRLAKSRPAKGSTALGRAPARALMIGIKDRVKPVGMGRRRGGQRPQA